LSVGAARRDCWACSGALTCSRRVPSDMWFTAEDHKGAPKSSLLMKRWPAGCGPARIRSASKSRPAIPRARGWRTVIGVVKDVRYMGPQEGPAPDMFLPCEQWPFSAPWSSDNGRSVEVGDPARLPSLTRISRYAALHDRTGACPGVRAPSFYINSGCICGPGLRSGCRRNLWRDVLPWPGAGVRSVSGWHWVRRSATFSPW
jgi:hypothetical protein